MVNVPCIVCSEMTDVTITCCNNSKKGMCKMCCLDHWHCPNCGAIEKFRNKLVEGLHLDRVLKGTEDFGNS